MGWLSKFLNIDTIGIILLIFFILYMIFWNNGRDILTNTKQKAYYDDEYDSEDDDYQRGDYGHYDSRKSMEYQYGDPRAVGGTGRIYTPEFEEPPEIYDIPDDVREYHNESDDSSDDESEDDYNDHSNSGWRAPSGVRKFVDKISSAVKNVPRMRRTKHKPSQSAKARRSKKINKHEEKCRIIFQVLFNQKFESVRPGWLKNPVTGRNLELDGFCPTIMTPLGRGLAFEYDGEQHSKYNKHFHRHGPDEFLYQVKKDSWKDLRCKQEGVMLIRIPHYIAYNELRPYIVRQLQKSGVHIPGGATPEESLLGGRMYGG
jgi:hypothetical protein